MSFADVPSLFPQEPQPPTYIVNVVMMSLNAVFFIPRDELGTEHITCESAGERDGHWFLKRVGPSVAEDATLPEYFLAPPSLLAELDGTLYVKQADGDWLRLDQLLSLNAAAMEEPGSSSGELTDVGDTPLLIQCDYSKKPGIQQAAMDLVIAYDDLRLRDALDGTGAPQRTDAPAFAQEDPIRGKLSIFVDLQHWRKQQHTVRFGNQKLPISRTQLAKLIATMVYEHMECHTVLHAGEAVAFDRLVLRSVRLASKATIQPEIGVLPAVDAD